MSGFAYVLRRWQPCSKGGGEDCPCQPPVETRCPESGPFGGCTILGDHVKHNDGHGTTWWRDEGDA